MSLNEQLGWSRVSQGKTPGFIDIEQVPNPEAETKKEDENEDSHHIDLSSEADAGPYERTEPEDLTAKPGFVDRLITAGPQVIPDISKEKLPRAKKEVERLKQKINFPPREQKDSGQQPLRKAA